MSKIPTQIPKSLAKSIPAIALRTYKNSLVVGVPDNLSKKRIDEILDVLVSKLNVDIELLFMNQNIIERNLEFVYGDFIEESDQFREKIKLRSESTVIDLVDKLLESAYRLRASDIHIEPLIDEVLIRIRVDGKLEKLTSFDIEICPAIISRLKVLSRLSIVERRKPQDGQFSAKVSGRELDFRLSTVSTLYGEKAALRLLDTHQNLGSLESLGMQPSQLRKLKDSIGGGNGLLISAGTTGSGKTTTMHSALKLINSPSLNVCTIEDPVEYVIPGINHLPVNDAIGLTFATQLRAVLRQDPDVVLVGEIRDAETARIAVQAALAGRLVLSTLHAPNAIGAIYRLYQMGIEPYQVAASLVGVISQRLIRKNCEFCSTSYSPSSALKNHVLNLIGTSKMNFQRGEGCTICRGSGFFGRIGAFQILKIDEEIRELISQRPSPLELERASRKSGLKSIEEEAFMIASQGKTSLEEAINFQVDDEK